MSYRTLFPALALLVAACAPLQAPVKPVTPTASGSQQQTSQIPAGEQDTPTPPAGSGAKTDERVLPMGALEVGAADAPVSMMLFTNHYCAYCQDFQEELMPRLVADYIAPGTVRVTVVPFLLQKYAESEQAARAFICAARQGKGLAMHSLLFQENMNSTAYRTALAGMGLDQAQLQACMESDGAGATVDALQSLAHSLNVTLVPAYFIDGTQFTGLPEYADLRGQLQEKLK